MSRNVIALVWAVALLSSSCASHPHAQVKGELPFRPNIIWITTEDIGPRLGSYGDSVAATPVLDRLARQGIRYTNAFSVSGVCAPSRAALITGMYPISIGTMHMRTTEDSPNVPGPYLAVPPPEVKTFTEYLRAAGYYTSNDNKTDYQFAPISDARQPFTAWDQSGTGADWRGRKPGQPFFAVINTMRTHESRVWPDSTEKPTLDPRRVVLPPYYPDTPVIRRDLARHYDNIARMDTWAGGILRRLEEEGLTDSTIVFFFGDNGDGLPRMKRWPYDSGIHVPLIIRFPRGWQEGTVEERLVSFVDFGPTVLSLAGVPIPKHMQGRAFLGSQAWAERQYVYAAMDRMDEVYDRIRAVRDTRYKYLRNYRPELPYVQPLEYRDRMPLMQELLRLHRENRLDGTAALWFSATKPPEELYDIVADPHEVHNLADDPGHREVLVRMRKALDGWLAEVGDLGSLPEVEIVERFWPGKKQPITRPPIVRERTKGDQIELTLSSPTEGASVAYTFDEGKTAHWHLYAGPIRVPSGAVLRAVAVRYGYRQSDETTWRLRDRQTSMKVP